jgi:hypothetical protein
MVSVQCDDCDLPYNACAVEDARWLGSYRSGAAEEARKAASAAARLIGDDKTSSFDGGTGGGSWTVCAQTQSMSGELDMRVSSG